MEKIDEDSWQKYRDKDRMRKKTKPQQLRAQKCLAAWRGEALLEMQSENDTLEVAMYNEHNSPTIGYYDVGQNPH